MKNNIILGGANWLDDSTVNPGNNGGNQLTAFYLMGGYTGNGEGTCGSFTPTEDYNVVYNTKNSNNGCGNTHDHCGVSPGFINQIPVGTIGGIQSTFYNAWSGISYMPISISSVANGSGVNSLSYWNNGNDYYNVTRAIPPSIGGLEYTSCEVDSGFCFLNSDCCSGTCTANACVGSGGGVIGNNLRDSIGGNTIMRGQF